VSVREQLRRLQEHPEFLERLKGSPEAQAIYSQLVELQQSNPLLLFEPHSQPQREFIQASTRVVAAFAGNRFGKSTALVVSALRELLDRDVLPGWLAEGKRFDAPLDGWILCPTDDKIYDSMMPALRKWCPQGLLKGGDFNKGWNGQRNILSFKNGSTLAFKTYKQEPSTLGGAELRFIGYDEPPPQTHREEARMRLMGGGFEMFAMTPLKTNTGYVKRVIWKRREAPNITVVKGSIHDNPTLDPEMIAEALGDMTDLWRRAREFGDFIDVGGLIYPEFEACVVDKPWSAEFIRSLDVVVGIDPGIRNAGFSWTGFDRDLTAYVFDEGLLQDKTAAQYVEFIRATNARWGLTKVSYVVDPAAKQRAQANGMTVLAEIHKAGVYPNLGQNDHELGFGQMRTRMAHGRFKVSPTCVGLRDEADEYAAKEPEEGRDDSYLEPVPGGAHRLDSLRYGVLERFWDPVAEQEAPNRRLGWEPNVARPMLFRGPAQEAPPMGSFS
jgi:hypothetical protein